MLVSTDGFDTPIHLKTVCETVEAIEDSRILASDILLQSELYVFKRPITLDLLELALAVDQSVPFGSRRPRELFRVIRVIPAYFKLLKIILIRGILNKL